MEKTGEYPKSSHMHEHKKEYWENYYANCDAPQKPSNFAEFCNDLIKPNSSVLDVGCGNCRDSNFFNLKTSVIAIDSFSNENFTDKGVFFIKSKIQDLQDIKCDYIYSRFFIHAIEDSSEDFFLKYIKRNCKNFFIEARSDKDSFDGDHFRRFVNKDKINNKLKSLGFKFDIIEEKGLAVHKDEDPTVIRIFGEV